MRIAFFGTPDFAIPSLQMLLENKHELFVFTQPDRPAGRHGTSCVPSPVKNYALEHGLPVFQPKNIKSEEGQAALSQITPDLMITASFGQIFSSGNLSVPRLGCINVHASLLPKYRGASPVHWAIICGETETGITTMFTDLGMDTGDMLLHDRIAIGPDETADELTKRLALLGAHTLFRTLNALQHGTACRITQDETEASFCPLLKKEHGQLDFKQSAQNVHNQVRGTNSWPGAYVMLCDKPLKIWRTRLSDVPHTYLPGFCFPDDRGELHIACQAGSVEVLELQSAGGKRLDSRSFLRGTPLFGRILA